MRSDAGRANLAKTDPVLFFQTYKSPVIIDEVQYAPELFSQIKIICDESDEPGLFWLTGSQQFAMMKNVRETLAGRIGILELYSLSKNEKDGVSCGCADAAEIAQPTAKEWLRLLEGWGIIYLLQPYSNNALKRLTKTPKLYFCDTGLCAHLSMWLTPETLMNGAASGHYFENFVVIEMLKGYAYSKMKVQMSYFRDSNAKEIDIFIEANIFVSDIPTSFSTPIAFRLDIV